MVRRPDRAHLRDRRLPKRDLLRRPDFDGIPLVKTRARFHRPVRFGDIVTIESKIVAVRKSSFDVEHRLTNGGELATEGFQTQGLDGA